MFYLCEGKSQWWCLNISVDNLILIPKYQNCFSNSERKVSSYRYLNLKSRMPISRDIVIFVIKNVIRDYIQKSIISWTKRVWQITERKNNHFQLTARRSNTVYQVIWWNNPVKTNLLTHYDMIMAISLARNIRP